MNVFRKLLGIAYAIFLLILGQVAARDSNSLGYPLIIVVLTVLTFAIMAVGVVLVSFGWGNTLLRRIWKVLFIICVADFAIGTGMDAVVPKDYSFLTHGVYWIMTSFLQCLLLVPGYYLNYRLAFKHGAVAQERGGPPVQT